GARAAAGSAAGTAVPGAGRGSDPHRRPERQAARLPGASSRRAHAKDRLPGHAEPGRVVLSQVWSAMPGCMGVWGCGSMGGVGLPVAQTPIPDEGHMESAAYVMIYAAMRHSAGMEV